MNAREFFARCPTPLVHATGSDLRAQVEIEPNPDRIDHVWITMDPGISSRVLVSINTSSLINRDAGFDSRIRVGKIRGTWDHLPHRGVSTCEEFDYRSIERSHNVFYEHFEREEMESLLLENSGLADLLEVWGAPYFRKIPGIHQIHSRRASCAVPEDLLGLDGALKFYFRAKQEFLLLLFKFCGQP